MSSDRVKRRRLEDDLYVSGTGVMLMGAWNVGKGIMQLMFESKEYLDVSSVDPSDRAPVITIAIVIIALMMIMVLKFHIYIGLNAVRAARGRAHKRGYVKAAVVLLVISLAGLAGYKDMFSDLENIDTTIASILVDLTTIYILVIMIASTRRIRKLEANAAWEEVHAD